MKIIVNTQSLKFNEETADFDSSRHETYGGKSNRYDLLIKEETIKQFISSDAEILVIELYKSKV